MMAGALDATRLESGMFLIYLFALLTCNYYFLLDYVMEQDQDNDHKWSLTSERRTGDIETDLRLEFLFFFSSSVVGFFFSLCFIFFTNYFLDTTC